VDCLVYSVFSCTINNENWSFLMAGPAYVDAFRRIVVQPDNIIIAADAVDDTLTLVAGAGISLVASATSDTITIVNTNTSSPSTELFARSLTVDGIIIDTNVIRSTDSNADLEITTNGTGSIRLNTNRVTIGSDAGATSQGTFAVAVGRQAGGNTQGGHAVAVGYQAGFVSQSDNAVAIGRQSGYLGGQGTSAVAVGHASAFTNQGDKAVAIGFGAGGTDQGLSAVSIGDLAGNLTQGNYAIAIGYSAGNTNQPANSIIINASGSTLNGSASGLYIDPIRNINGGRILTYDTINKEIGYTANLDDITVGSIRINTNVIQTVDSNADLELDANGTGAIQLRSNLKLVDGTSPDGAWTSYTPTWTASVTNPVLGDGTIDGRYKQFGKIVHFYINILMGSTTTFGTGDWRVSLPVASQNNFNVIANVMYLDNTTQWYEGSALNAFTGSTTTLTMYYTNTTASNITPFNWAAGDYLVITGTYEAS